MKNFLLLLCICFSVSINAQIVDVDSTILYKEVKILDTGDYLIKASNNLWVSLGCAVVSGIFLYSGAKLQMDGKSKSAYGAMYGIGAVSGAVTIAFFPIMFSINLSNAGERYKEARKPVEKQIIETELERQQRIEERKRKEAKEKEELYQLYGY